MNLSARAMQVSPKTFAQAPFVILKGATLDAGIVGPLKRALTSQGGSQRLIGWQIWLVLDLRR